MNLTQIALEKRTLTNFIIFLIVAGGLLSYATLGRLEDPDFTVKTAVIITGYPGASPQEVELEVTDRLEQAIQEMPQLDMMYSQSRAGLSIIRVDMKEEYWSDRLPQVWDELRRKVSNTVPLLPPGALKPDVGDDFSFVFGFVLSISGEDYSYAELETYAKKIRKEMSLVSGVSRVDLWGAQPKVVYIDISDTQLAALSISKEDVLATLALQNAVVNAGSVNLQGQRLRVEVSGAFSTPEEIGELTIRRSLVDMLANAGRSLGTGSNTFEEVTPTGSAAGGSSAAARSNELIRIKDIATVREGYLEPAIMKMRFNGQEAIGIQAANVVGGNIITTGANLDERLAQLKLNLPAGINVDKFFWQSDLVAESVNGFVLSLVEAVLIVLAVIAIAMGWRMGLVIGWSLIVTILGTFLVMKIMGISLERISLGALVVALGMMVDNAIVVADNYSVRLKRRMKPVEAAIDSATAPGMALLGATIVAVMAFYPVFGAPTGAGEYGRGLFIVVGISLVISWIVAMTMTPMNCMSMIKPPADDADSSADPYSSGFFRGYKKLLESAIRYRAITVIGMLVLLVGAGIGFTGVPQQFFPDSTRTQFMIDYWAPHGTTMKSVSADLRGIEEKLDGDPRVTSVGTFMGAGGPRFYLPVDPEYPYSSYGQLIIATPTYEDVVELIDELTPWVTENYPQALTRVRKYTVGPGDTWPFELRIAGPAEADLDTLRRLGEEGMAILRASPLAKQVRTDMRQRVQKVVVDYDQERARWAAVSRVDVAQATGRAYDGTLVGLYRENDNLLPIIARNAEEDRQSVAGQMDLIQVQPSFGLQTAPLGQVVEGIRLEWEDPIISRFNRRRQVAIQASPDGDTFPALRADVKDKFDAMELPPGFDLMWDGEYDSTMRAQLSLLPGMIPAFVIMTLIIVALFNSLKPSLIIAMVVPFALIGITAILLPTQTAFGFMALLGAMSLVGLMIKNAIVLLDEIAANKKSGLEPYDAVVAAGMSRVQPVVLGAATTVLGVIPLVFDAFWISMALTMMFGLLVGTVLTMVMVPTFYAIVYKVMSPAR
jgi:multidrug efflux pump subunit AcrB